MMRPRRLSLVLGLLLAVAAPVRAATANVVDPATGKSVRVEHGAAALHLVFFATWCSSCVKELDALRDLEARWTDRGYRLLLIAVESRHDAARLQGFVAEQSPPGRLLFDSKGEAAGAFKASQLPTHVVLDPAGREVARSNRLDAGVERAVAELLDDRRGRRPGR